MQPKRIGILAVVCLGASIASAQQVTINCGGVAYTATNGTAWAGDEGYNGGDLVYTSDNISNTNDLYLFRSARAGLYGDFTYNIPVTNGSYNLSLLFAELQYWNPGDRIFNVIVNGSPVLTNFDIVAQAGARAALTKTFPVTVTTGALQIAVNGVVRRGILNGIQIAPASAAPPVPAVSVAPSSLAFTATLAGANPPVQTISIANSGGGALNWTASKTQPWLALSATSGTGAASLSVQPATGSLAAGTYTDTITIAAAGAIPASQTVAVTFTVAPPAGAAPLVSINCGGGAFTGLDGTNWSGDEYFTGGDLAYTGYQINGTQDLYLYRSARQGLYGDFSYSIPLPNGTYSLKLRFAEILYDAQGQRVFNVTANGTPLLTNFDILSEVAPLTADDKTFPVTVANGTLQLNFIGVAGRGIVNGIQVFPAAVTGAPALSVTPSTLAFTAAAGGSNPAAQTITIANAGGGTLSWTASKSQSWLTLSATSGAGAASLSVQPAIAGLAAGTYTDTVTIARAGASGSPQTVAVTLTVLSTPSLSVAPSSLAFTAAAGGSNPAAQTITIANAGGGTLSWTASKSQSWLTLSATSGAGAASLSVQPAIAGLAAGTYTDTVTIAAPGASGSPQTVAVTLTITAAAPSVTSFTANPAAIAPGQPLTLTWSTANATSVSIAPGIGTVSASGSATVTPAATTTYTLTAANSAGSVSSTITVAVSSSPSGNPNNTDQWIPNNNPPQTYNPNGGPVLYNGIQLPAAWPPIAGPSQTYTRPPYIQNPPAVIPIDTGRQLFVDDFLIGYTNLTRVQHQPAMYPGNPVLSPGTGWDRINDAFPYSDGAWYDPADQLYKMWYFGGEQGNEMCYAWSLDGVHWTKPAIADAAVPNTNIVLLIWGGRDTTTVWMDLRDVPSRKFKAFVTYSNGPGGTYVIDIFFSPDGIHWTGPQSVAPAALSDRTTAFYNPFRGVWVDSARNPADFPAAPTRGAYHSQRERYYSESPDLQTWTPSDPYTCYWTGTDERDPAYPGASTIPQLYNLDAVAYESVMVGMFSWYYPDSPDLVELGVGFSRDGFHWVRPTRGGGPANAFIAAANNPSAWNGYNTQSAGGAFLVVGNQLYFYFSGRNSLHNSETASTLRQTGLATLRRDGFYSMQAGASQGILTTRPVKFSGGHLFVNVADAAGQLQAEVLDSNGNVIPGFAHANSTTIAADTTKQEITWSGASLASLAGQSVEFRFYLTNGDLYAFWVSPSASGASNGYIAANGPGFTSDTDK